MRKRPVGIGALQKDKQRLELFQQKGTVLANEEIKKLAVQMDAFRKGLSDFIAKHNSEIMKNNEFRREFQSMCAVAGIDPLRSRKTAWHVFLGLGNYYYRLAIQIVEIFMATSGNNGGIMSIEELQRRLIASRSADENLRRTDSITVTDILEAIKKLRVLGASIREIPIKDSYVIHSTPAELNSDQSDITQLAYSENSFVSETILKDKLNWSSERAQKALNELVMDGIVWVDDQGPETQYWLPGTFTRS